MYLNHVYNDGCRKQWESNHNCKRDGCLSTPACGKTLVLFPRSDYKLWHNNQQQTTIAKT